MSLARAAGLTRPAPSPITPDVLGSTDSVTEALAELVDRHPRYECLTILDRHWNEHRTTLAEVWSRAKSVQAAVEERGLGRGDAALLVFPTGPELIAGYLGVMLAGGAPAVLATPSNRVADPGVYTRHLGTILGNARARVLFCEDRVADLCKRDDGASLGSAQLLRSRDVAASSAPPDTVASGGEDTATIQYSSGSTGTPKGVLLTHRALLNQIRAVRKHLSISSADVSVNWIPLYHDMGLIDAFLLPLLSGCPTVLIPTMDFLREPALWLWGVHGYRGTISWSPNFGYSLCVRRLSEDAVAGLDLSSWRLAMNGAEPVLAETVEAFCERFGAHGFAATTMTPAWGLSESGPVTTTQDPHETTRIETIDRERMARQGRAEPSPAGGDREKSLRCVGVGKVVPGCRIEIRDDERRPLPDRSVGEIWVTNDFLFSEYKDEPELTAEALVDGWLDTGDQGYLVDGHLYFVARSKDLIIIGGEKYIPHDVEEAINSVPGVREGCAVAFGVTNEAQGTEELGAVVETREEGEAARAALESAIRLAVTRSTGIGLRHLHLVGPGGVVKTTSGKLARRATREAYPQVFGRTGRER